MTTIRMLDSVFRWTLATLCVTLISIMIVAIGGQVVMRYAFGAPWVWSEELARYSMVWLVMLGAGLASRYAQHIALTDFVPISPRLLRLMLLLAGVVSLAMLAFLLWHSLDLVQRVSRQTTPSLGLPMSWVYAALPVGFGLMILGTILNATMLFLSTRDTAAHSADTLQSAG